MTAVRPTGLGVALLAAAALCAGCGGVETLSFSPPPASGLTPPSTAPTTTLPVTVGVILPGVPGVTTTTAPAVTGGSATIRGTVTGPPGVVGGATVEATRVVGGATASVKATTKPDGSFSITGLVGGDYRVRAWQQPNLAMTTPLVFFLQAGTDRRVTLDVKSFSGPAVAGVFNPQLPVVDQPTSLAVQVTTPTVGSDGVVRQPPVAGALVELTNGPGWVVVGSNPVPTAANGEATFTVACVSAGDQPIDASVNGQAPQALNPPPCQEPPPPPPPPTSPPATTAPPTTPPSTSPTSGTSTTTSTSTTSSTVLP